ncbi:glycosyltransferase family 4 protein [Agrobacterium radiobacter]|uniref:glycosyltransferase family 4 protein n=1 Tax=Agrobacterium radiobacter TaxID=362 RepID=UPI003467DE9D
MRLLHSIFWDYFIDRRFGGPPGYLAHLRAGLDQLPPNPEFDIWIDCYPEAHFAPQGPHRDPSQQELISHIRYFEEIGNFELSEAEFDRLMRHRPASVHLHTSPLAYKVIRTFKRHGITGIPVILTSHTPESNGKEMADQYRVPGIDPRLCDRFERAVRFIEALAFQAADIWMFPSREAMEPYFATIPKFDTWMNGKDIRYVETGACLPRQSVFTDQAKAKFGLSGRKVISFMGRHNEVKGYDVFCDAATKLLAEREDVTILVAGAPNPLIEAPRDPRWIELGWYGYPGDVLAASDVFVLPNRMTYFDLVLIEAIGMKTRVVASSTGGNKSVAKMSKNAIALFDGSIDDLKRQISNVLDDTLESTRRLVDTLDRAYEQYFTPLRFASRYQEMIHDVYRDHGIRGDQMKPGS